MCHIPRNADIFVCQLHDLSHMLYDSVLVANKIHFMVLYIVSPKMVVFGGLHETMILNWNNSYFICTLVRPKWAEIKSFEMCKFSAFLSYQTRSQFQQYAAFRLKIFDNFVFALHTKSLLSCPMRTSMLKGSTEKPRKIYKCKIEMEPWNRQREVLQRTASIIWIFKCRDVVTAYRTYAHIKSKLLSWDKTSIFIVRVYIYAKAYSVLWSRCETTALQMMENV